MHRRRFRPSLTALEDRLLLSDLAQRVLAERQSRPISESIPIVRTGLTFEDLVYHIDVYAPPGEYFVEYANGAIETRELPPGTPPGQHPSVQDVQAGTRQAADVGSIGKPAARTGLTVAVNGPSGPIDVHAEPGTFFIEYVDGTVEQRQLPPGGFVPRVEDLPLGGVSNAVPKSTFLPPTPAPTTSSAPKPSSQLILIGGSYVSSSGQVRTAPAGQVYLQDPETGTILLRPLSDATLAMAPTPASQPATTSITTAVASSIPNNWGPQPIITTTVQDTAARRQQLIQVRDDVDAYYSTIQAGLDAALVRVRNMKGLADTVATILSIQNDLAEMTRLAGKASSETGAALAKTNSELLGNAIEFVADPLVDLFKAGISHILGEAQGADPKWWAYTKDVAQMALNWDVPSYLADTLFTIQTGQTAEVWLNSAKVQTEVSRLAALSKLNKAINALTAP